MRVRNGILLVVAAAVLVGGGLVLGRVTKTSHGYSTGYSSGYQAGLRAGNAEGRQEGRALQEGNTSTEPFNDGYVAGANDAFTGYDGGWDYDVPYVITLEKGNGQIVYRISDRTLFQPGIGYSLCPDGHHLCEQAR
jgi:hypothetical protein